jgi:hypothetical protein
MRQYEPIWIKLKASGEVSIAAPRQMHKRIIKAVHKEKYNDLAFRILLQEDHKRSWISNSASHNKLTFKLNYSIGIGDL